MSIGYLEPLVFFTFCHRNLLNSHWSSLPMHKLLSDCNEGNKIKWILKEQKLAQSVFTSFIWERAQTLTNMCQVSQSISILAIRPWTHLLIVNLLNYPLESIQNPASRSRLASKLHSLSAFLMRSQRVWILLQSILFSFDVILPSVASDVSSFTPGL